MNNKRWRANVGGRYYTLSAHPFNLEVITCTENNLLIDDARYRGGNYFRKKKQARKVLKEINDIFQNAHK